MPARPIVGSIDDGAAPSASAYETLRLENIRQNEALLRELELADAAAATRSRPRAAPAPARGLQSATRRKREDAPPAPVRKSARLAGLPTETAAPEAGRASGSSARSDLVPSMARALGDIDLGPVDGRGDPARFARLLTDVPVARAGRAKPFVLAGARFKLAEGDVAKVVRERVYRLAVHPRADRLIVLAGDKGGQLGVWDADEPDAANELLLLQPHRQVLSGILVLPHREQTVLTSSYDGTVRALDLVKQRSHELFHTASTETYITTLDCKDGHTLCWSDSDGEVVIKDLRASAREVMRHSLSDKKIKTVDVHPRDTHVLATASLDRSVCIWDARHMKKPTAEFAHDLSVNSAHFSPHDGRQLLSTSYDDTIRVFSRGDGADAWAQTHSFRHNNQTGRWVTNFCARWLPWAPGGFAVGSMSRAIDVFATDAPRALAQLQGDALTTVPAVVAAHPSLPVIVGGVASGRCFVFRA